MKRTNIILAKATGRRTMCGILLAVLTLTQALGMSAQETQKKTEPKLLIIADVKDHLTHEWVKVTDGAILHAADSTWCESLHTEYGDDFSVVYGYIHQPGDYLIKVKAEGYVTKYVPLSIKKLYKSERQRELKPIYMHRQPKKLEVELGEVTVTATKVKFYMDGDTLVYNADAFNMAEGSMLDALIKKLPGVELTQGGVIKVNGRTVSSLLLNGKDFFDDDRELLLENMPTYMVKQVRSYERVPEELRGTNREKTAEGELVMDVRLKREYSVGWVANAEAGGGASFYKNDDGRHEGKYLGRLFGLRFTDRSRLALFANVNNLNDYRVPGERGEWSPLTQSQGLTSQVKVGANYQREVEDRYRYQGSANTTYYDKDDANNVSSATFLAGGDTYRRSFWQKRSYDWEVNTEHRYELKRPNINGELLKSYSFRPEAKLNYLRWNNHTESAAATLAADVASQLGKVWMDSLQAPNAGDLLRRYAINRTMSRTKGIGHWLDAQTQGNLSLTPTHNDYIDFDLTYWFQLTDRAEDNYEHYLLDYPNSTTANDFRNRYNPTTDKTQTATIQPSVIFGLDKEHRHQLVLDYNYTYTYTYNNHPLYLLQQLAGWTNADSQSLGLLPSATEMLTTLDVKNSSLSEEYQNSHNPGLSYSWRLGKMEGGYSAITAQFSLPMYHQRLRYQQGTQIDTLLHHNITDPYATIRFYHSKWQRGRNIQVYYRVNKSTPGAITLLNLRDDSDPLNISTGNPDLKSSIRHSFQANYSDKFGKTLVNSNANLSATSNAIAYGFTYDRSTGVRTTRPENVNGNWTAHADFNIDFPLDKKDRWRMKQNIGYDYNHNVDLAGTTEAIRSVVASSYINEDLALVYRPTDKMEFGVNGKLYYQHSTSQRTDFTTINAYTYQYGANAQIELPWNFQLSTDLTMYSRRGYSEPSMNTNELVWNARLSKRFLHGNLVCMLDGFDLLGNLSNVRRTINAQGRTETFYNVIPSYGLLHIVYRLNKEPKKK